MEVKHLSLQVTKEVFHSGIIVAIPFARHTLSDSLFFQSPLIRLHLILPSLIGVQYQISFIGQPLKGTIQHTLLNTNLNGSN